MTPGSPKKQRPFPWTCPNCKNDSVVPVTIPYTARIKQDGIMHTVSVAALEVPRCSVCAEVLITDEADEQVNRALRKQLGLLLPEQILANRTALGLSRQELAEQIGVAEETISGWETGAFIQGRAMDTLLRLYFGLPEARSALVDPNQRLALGAAV
jgi:putative zinc finger/helix-turn-helix YgiT family protein